VNLTIFTSQNSKIHFLSMTQRIECGEFVGRHACMVDHNNNIVCNNVNVRLCFMCCVDVLYYHFSYAHHAHSGTFIC